MSHFDIANAYGEAERIIHRAELDTVDIHAVWQKVYRVRQYLRAQAAEELKEILA